MYRIVVVVFVFTLTLFADSWLTQEGVDSLTQSAYYGFVAAAGSAEEVYSQKSAIKSARLVAEKLREKAEYEPHRHYILFELEFLEKQIRAELQEARFRAQYATVTSMGTLISSTKKELNARFPSFSHLYKLYERMLLVDPTKVGNLDKKISEKSQTVTKDIRSTLQDAINKGEIERVAQFYDYAIENRKYLGVGVRELQLWSKVLLEKWYADNLEQEIATQVSAVAAVAKTGKIAIARYHVDVLQMEREIASAHLSKGLDKELNTALLELATNVILEEYAMVKYNLKLIEDRRIEKAYRYYQDTLLPGGVNPEKCEEIERALAKQGVGSFVATESDESYMQEGFETMASKAKAHYESARKSEIKSRQMQEEEKQSLRSEADTYLAAVADEFALGDARKAVKMFIKKHPFLRTHASPHAYYDVKIQVNATRGVSNHVDAELRELHTFFIGEQPEKKEEEALNHTTEIYSLLDEGRTNAAYGHFLAHELLLKKHSYSEAFVTLKKMVVEAYYKENKL